MDHPLVFFALITAAALWVFNGFPPLGFPTGEYVCTSRSGTQPHPISVYNPTSGPPMKVIEYRPDRQVDVSSGMSYTHSLFSRDLNLYLEGQSYYCVHRG